MAEIRHANSENQKRHSSLGAKVFDGVTYAGIAGVGTFMMTAAVASLFNKGRPLHGIDQWLRKTLPKIGASEHFADKATDTTNLMWGGNLMLIPVAWMEHKRSTIVNALNRAFKDPTDPKSIESAPPQTFGSIVKGRLLAWGAVFGGLWSVTKAFPDKFESFQRRSGELWCKLRRAPQMEGGLPTPQYHTGRTIALDVFATATSATILYLGSHFFANRASRKRDEKLHEIEGNAHPAEAAPRDIVLPAKTAEADPKQPGATVSHAELDAPLATISQTEQQPSV